MPELLRMPEVAANTEEATLTGWPVPEHQRFAASDVIATVETAKAAVDVEAETDGVILKVLVTAGSDVRVGDPIALIAAPDEQVADIDSALAALGVGAAAPPPAPPPAPVTNGARVFVSPLARRLAKEAGLDHTTLTGSGPNGRITRVDVAAAIARRAPEPVPVAVPVVAHDDAVVPHSRLRRTIAARLIESKQTIPHFYLRGSARVDRLLALRAELNGLAGQKISVNDLVVKAVARAHATVAGVNAIWTDGGMRHFDTVDVGVAVATDTGLVTPVVRDVDRSSVTAVASATRELAERARTGGLKQDELAGGAITVTNLGMYGTEEFAAIINPPQSSILAVGAGRQEPVVTDGELAVATVLRVTLSVDHRVIDGALAAQWMREFLAILEQPLRILA